MKATCAANFDEIYGKILKRKTSKESLSVHITHFHISKHVSFLQRILDEYDTFENVDVFIFIHTNTNIDDVFKWPKQCFYQTIIHTTRTNENPFYLTWKCRTIMKNMKDIFDYICYTEDDILMPEKTFIYWLKYKDICIEHQFNLGFFRIEVDKDQTEFIVDLTKDLHKTIKLNDTSFVLNDNNPYVAMWIYDKVEFGKWIDSSLYDIKNIRGYGIQEMSAIGLHGLQTNWFKGTILPIVDLPKCKLYHLENKYISHKVFSSIQFNEIHARLKC